MQPIHISIIQSNIFWEDKVANLKHYEKQILDLKANEQEIKTDIIILPEMFNTGFTMKASLFAEKMNDETVQWMQRQAAQHDCIITGSLIIQEADRYYNRLIWMRPDGSHSIYDKRHLFRMGKEDLTYTGGNKKLIVTHKGWRICPLICYDLRFPVWSRKTKKMDYDCLIYVASWPQIRRYPWQQLLIARAIENQAFVVGVNRIGEDGHGLWHSGDSAVIDFRGHVCWTQTDRPSTHTYALSKRDLVAFRSQFPAWMDADDFEVTPIHT